MSTIRNTVSSFYPGGGPAPLWGGAPLLPTMQPRDLDPNMQRAVQSLTQGLAPLTEPHWSWVGWQVFPAVGQGPKGLLDVIIVYLLSRVWLLWPHGPWPARLLCPGISQARILEWVAISFSGGIFLTHRLNPYLLLGRQTLYHWATTREALTSL